MCGKKTPRRARFDWQTAAADEGAAARLAGELAIPRAIALALVARGFADAGTAERFIHARLSDLSDPFALPGMAPAVERIWRALDRHERIVVYGDYDADGITATAVLVSVLRKLGAHAEPFLPNRLSEGYGFTAAGADRCLKERRPELIVTVDCGVSSREVVAEIQRRNVDIVVTDHHEVPAEGAPAAAVVNPKVSAVAGTSVLAGVGVAFKLCHGLLKEGLKRGDPRVANIDLREWLDLVAVGTVADVVPLTGENRALVRHGLKAIESTKRPGLQALKRVAGVGDRVTAYHIGFMLGPRLNASGRLGDADAALELLVTEDPPRALKLAEQLEEANKERREIEENILGEALVQAEDAIKKGRKAGVVVGDAGWHAGVIGVVASRVCAQVYRPVVVVALGPDGMGRGSCRSVEGVDLVEALNRCCGLLVDFGGHKAAAGLTVRAEDYERFAERFDAVCREMIGDRRMAPVHMVDAWVTLGEVDAGLLAGIDLLRPLGYGNPTPIWGVRNVQPAGVPRRIGKGGAHLKLALCSGPNRMEGIGFGLGDRDVPPGDLDVLFHLEENNYLGRKMLQLHIKDFRPSSPGADARG